MLHREHADALAAGQPRKRIRHMQADPLLAHDDRSNSSPGGELQHMVHRITEDDLDPFAFQDLGNGRTGFHELPPPLAPQHMEPSPGGSV